MLTARTDAAFDENVSGTGVGPGRVWRQISRALTRLWAAAIAPPERGDAATPADLPPEYFRFPCY